MEVRAGDGSPALTSINNFSHLAFIEISEKRIEELSKLFDGKNVEILTKNLGYEDLRWSENTFDLAVMVDVIEHLIDPIRLCKEIHRVLKRGGFLLIGTPNIAKITRRIKLAAGSFPSTASLDEGLLMYDKRTPTDLFEERHLHYFTYYRSLHKMLKDRCGFKKFKHYGYGSFRTMKIPYAVARFYPTLFSENLFLACK